MGEGIMKSSEGFAWMWGTALVCFIGIGYFMWKKKQELLTATAIGRVPSATNVEENNVYVPSATPVATAVPAKVV
ncbi:hypothetical protein AaE_009714 [Aphanomyces astaci]|nr:hypothetical protein AaE_009714 [Aphanomyces astaci]